MPRVSQNFVSQKIKKELDDAFEETLLLLNTPEKTKAFSRAFFTPEERTMFGKRLSIAIFLRRGWHYAGICRLFKVSATTVRSIQNRLEDEGGIYEGAVLFLPDEKRRRQRWEKLFDILRLPMKGSKSDMLRWKKALDDY